MLLPKMLGITNGQNAIAEAIKDFRATVKEQQEVKGNYCGRKYVVISGGRDTAWRKGLRLLNDE